MIQSLWLRMLFCKRIWKQIKTFSTPFSIANLTVNLMIQHKRNKVSQHGGISSRLHTTGEHWGQAIIRHRGQQQCLPTCSLTLFRQMSNVSHFHKEACITFLRQWTSQRTLISLPRAKFSSSLASSLKLKNNILNNSKIFTRLWYLVCFCIISNSVPFIL